MGMFRKINYIFDAKQKGKLIILIFLIFIASILELIGVSAILPLINIVMEPQVIQENSLFIMIGEIFSLETVNDFILFLSLLLGTLYIFKNVYLVLYKNYQL